MHYSLSDKRIAMTWRRKRDAIKAALECGAASVECGAASVECGAASVERVRDARVRRECTGTIREVVWTSPSTTGAAVDEVTP